MLQRKILHDASWSLHAAAETRRRQMNTYINIKKGPGQIMFFCFEPFYVYHFSQMKCQLQSHHGVSALAVSSAWKAFTEDTLAPLPHSGLLK